MIIVMIYTPHPCALVDENGNIALFNNADDANLAAENHGAASKLGYEVLMAIEQ